MKLVKTIKYLFRFFKKTNTLAHDDHFDWQSERLHKPPINHTKKLHTCISLFTCSFTICSLGYSHLTVVRSFTFLAVRQNMQIPASIPMLNQLKTITKYPYLSRNFSNSVVSSLIFRFILSTLASSNLSWTHY